MPEEHIKKHGYKIDNPQIRLEAVSCDFCQNTDSEPLFKAKIVGDDFLDRSFYSLEFPLVKCKKCNLVYINPRPIKESMNFFYPPLYYNNHREQSYFFRLRKKMQEDVFRRHGTNTFPGWWSRLFIEPHVQIVIGQPKEGLKVLEIGFGAGDLLDRLKNIGYETYGIETEEEIARKAKERGHKTFVGSVEEYDFGDLKFDLVVMQNVLEHVYSPMKILRKVNSILSKDGKLVLSVPNFNSAQSRIFRELWYGLDAPRHLFHFSPDTLRNILKACNFEEIEYKSTSFLKKILSLKVMLSFTRGKLPLRRIIAKILKEYFIYLPLSIIKRRYREDFALIFTLYLRKSADLENSKRV